MKKLIVLIITCLQIQVACFTISITNKTSTTFQVAVKQNELICTIGSGMAANPLIHSHAETIVQTVTIPACTCVTLQAFESTARYPSHLFEALRDLSGVRISMVGNNKYQDFFLASSYTIEDNAAGAAEDTPVYKIIFGGQEHLFDL